MHLIKYGYLEEIDGQATLTNTDNIFSDDTSDIHLPAIAASVTNRIAFGANAGKPIQRIRTVDSHRMWSNEADLEHTGDACVASGGYLANAATCVKPHQRERLEKLIRYMSRSAIAEDRLEILENDRVRIELAIERETRQVIAFHVGGRTGQDALLLWEANTSRL